MSPIGLQTPHNGYHWDGSSRRFFEGWYYRLTLPSISRSFAFMYSIDDPAGGTLHTGGAVQILGSDDRYVCRSFPNPNRFWAKGSSLSLGHWGKSTFSFSPQLVSCDRFADNVREGYQATATLNQGQIYDPLIDGYHRWCYEIKPIYGWGQPQGLQRATAGWLSYLPIADPGWQVLIAKGLATGWIEWYGQRWEFQDALAYSEKNWGRSFPSKWFWINALVFEQEPDLTVTAVGGIRQFWNQQEAIGLIGIHHQGRFYSFDRHHYRISWQVAPWGYWRMVAEGDRGTLEIEGKTDEKGSYVRVPTENGLKFRCRDTCNGRLTLKLSDRAGKCLIHAHTELAGLEIGGEPWGETWQVNTQECN
jgi:tocopherol cyclase